ncbi:hypothetical protein [Methanoculleus sp.]|uniref:DUF7289 family protein n=1 Tax=Methanoculleus sp. TaxID=90427 RepID=UPI0025E3CCB4|nr:hypothetical protein [Methanoculleus sp.]
MMNDKAVSEAIGFILILGIVISGIGLVTLYGYPVLVKEQSNTDVKNMERAMIVIQNDMKSLCFKNVPYKETTLQVSGGTLAVVNASDSEAYFTIETSTPDGTYDSGPLSIGGLRYRSDRGTEVITLENGAVMTRQEGAPGSAMLAEPRWFHDRDPDTNKTTLVVYIMKITADEPMAKSGMGAVRMSLEGTTTSVYTPTDPVRVTYGPDSDNDLSVAWENYLTGSSVGMQRIADNQYQQNDVDKLVIKVYTIKIYGI